MERSVISPIFVREAQMANYEASALCTRGATRNCSIPPLPSLLNSNPAQRPEFCVAAYHYDLEPMSSYFAVMRASELVHIQFNEADGQVQVIDNDRSPLPDAVPGLRCTNMDGSLAYRHERR